MNQRCFLESNSAVRGKGVGRFPFCHISFLGLRPVCQIQFHGPCLRGPEQNKFVFAKSGKEVTEAIKM